MNAHGTIDTSWSDLCANPFIPAHAQTPQWLTPLLECDPNGNAAAILFEHDGALKAITGLKRHRFGITADSIDNGFLFCGNPLLAAQHPDEALIGLLTSARNELAVNAVYFKKVTHADKFNALLNMLVQSRAIPTFDRLNSHERACLEAGMDFDTWFTRNFSRKRRKEYRRLEARLAETGKLEHFEWQYGQDPKNWLEDFLKLEKSGWKGRRGTAMACNPAQVRHITQAINLAARARSLRFWKSTLDGDTIAMLFAFTEEGYLWLGKIAYREDLSQFSPGVMIILNATRTILADPDIYFADSSADANHPMIDNIWRDRLPTADFLIPVPGVSATQFGIISGAEQVHQTARSTLKTLRNKLRAIVT